MAFEIKWTTNHPEWYTKKTVKVAGGGFINYRQVNGLLAGIPDADALTNGPEYTTTVSTAMRLQLVDMIPGATENTVREAYTELWLQCRSGNVSTASPPYTAGHVQAFVYNVSECVKLLSIGERIYKILSYYPVEDSTMPLVLAAAMNVDISSFQDSISDLRNRLFLFRQFLASKVFLPLPLFERKGWLYSNIFADYNGDKASHYVPIPRDFAANLNVGIEGVSFFEWTPENAHPTANIEGAITYQQFVNLLGEYQNSVFWFQSNIAALITEAKKVFKVSPIKVDILPEKVKASDFILYDEYALTQIQNGFFSDYKVVRNRTSSHGFAIDKPGLDVVDTTNYSYYIRVTTDPVINGWGDAERNPGRQLSLTRLCPSIRWPGGANDAAYIEFFGSEVGGQAIAFRMSSNSNAYRQLDWTHLGFSEVVITTSNGGDAGGRAQTWSQYDFAPRTVLIVAGNPTGNVEGCYLDLFDYTDFGILYRTNAETMERLANWSLLSATVPAKEEHKKP